MKLPQMSDQEIIAYLKTATSVKDWNAKREEVKLLRSSRWIAQNLDASGLIVQTLGK